MNYAFSHCSYEIDNEQGHPHDSEFSLFSAVITAESLNWFSCWWCERRKWENKSYRGGEKCFECRLLFVIDFSKILNKRHEWWIWMIFKNKQSEKIFFVSSSSSAWELLIIYQNCKDGRIARKNRLYTINGQQVSLETAKKRLVKGGSKQEILYNNCLAIRRR